MGIVYIADYNTEWELYILQTTILSGNCIYCRLQYLVGIVYIADYNTEWELYILQTTILSGNCIYYRL